MKPTYRCLLCCVVVLLAWPVAVLAQDAATDTLDSPANQLTIDASLLTRGELRHGGLPMLDGTVHENAQFVMERTRLALSYRRGQWLQARVTAQHAGIWGQAGRGSFNLYEAWARIQASCGMFATVGRQELNYDDERILGRNDWAMAAMSHDAIKMGYEGHGHKAHVILAYNQRSDADQGNSIYRTSDGAYPHRSMIAAWYHYDVPTVPLGASLMFIDMGMQNPYMENPPTHHQQLFGCYARWQPTKWNFEGAYYRQCGHDEFGIPIEAWMASAKADFSPNDRWTLTAGYDHLSGDPNPVVPHIGTIGMALHTKVQGFSVVFGSHHKFYGAMDFFYASAYYAGYTPGLQNLYAQVSCKPVKRLGLMAGYHHLATSSRILDARRKLGDELELSAAYSISNDVKLAAGYTYMHGTSTLERLQQQEGRNKLHWGWLMLTVSPRLFNVKW